MIRGFRFLACIVSVIAVMSGGVWGQEEASAKIQPVVFGSGSTNFGQIVSGQYTFARTNDATLSHYWIQRAVVQLGLQLKQSNGLEIVIASEGQMYFPYAGPGDGSGFGYELLKERYKFYPIQADAAYTLGDPAGFAFTSSIGLFPFKYNPDGRNFGDYFYRMSTYPQYMPTSFDMPYERLLGLHTKFRFLTNYYADLLLTSELYLWPLRDFSQAVIVGGDKIAGLVDVSAGIMWHRLFTVDKSLTTPSKANQSGNEFSFAGTKAMVRGALDFKGFMPFDFWGKNDLRLYSELCLNGLQNYPVTDTTNPFYPGYNDILKRMPVLIGFNVPTCKILDVLSVEAEWWDTYPFANSYWGVYPVGYKQNPFPNKYVSTNLGHKQPWGGPWHWSVYTKKNVLNNVNLIFQVARDHTILETTLTGTSNADPQEAMDGLGNWSWMGKVEYCF